MIKLPISNNESKLCGGIFDYSNKSRRLQEVKRELENPEIWKNPQKAQQLGKEQTQLKEIINQCDTLHLQLQDSEDLLELVILEQDQTAFLELESEVQKISKQIQDLEFRRMFSHDLDPNNAYLEIQSGSGGTEAQDWAEMLLRMYLRWGDKRGFETTLTELSPGDVAGIKSATVEFVGPYAYGWLRTETGVHRLVRKSPFDSGNRRHTSFASVFISPEISDDIEIEINPTDVRTDTYRASGKGGQHVNKTDSAVRLTHLPSNTVVQCQSERSQHKNRDRAWKQLRAKLYELEMLKKREHQQAIEDSKSEISWGYQIRSYVLDASRIKDLRTGVETTNTQGVLDGDLDSFIEASLKQGVESDSTEN